MSKQRTLEGKVASENEKEEIEPWDLADRYYEQWRDEQAILGKWGCDEIEIGV